MLMSGQSTELLELIAKAEAEGKNPGAVMLGKARAAKLTPERRREIARKAIRARWDRAKAKDLIS